VRLLCSCDPVKRFANKVIQLLEQIDPCNFSLCNGLEFYVRMTFVVIQFCNKSKIKLCQATATLFELTQVRFGWFRKNWRWFAASSNLLVFLVYLKGSHARRSPLKTEYISENHHLSNSRCCTRSGSGNGCVGAL
jgi:hypothetical protein